MLAPTLAVGCGGKSDGPDLAKVGGTVTYQGKPLPNAQVLFLPDTPGAPSANGTTDKNGYYQLTTRTPGDGALVGKHRVTVTARGPDKVIPGNTTTSGMPGNDVEPGDPLIPQKYFIADTSGLNGEVKSGKNTIDFDLTQ